MQYPAPKSSMVAAPSPREARLAWCGSRVLRVNVSGGFVVSRLSAATGGTAGLLQAAVGAGLVLAGLDVLVVMRRNRKHTRMSKQEVRDENKNSEGDPLVRSQRRSRQLAMSRNRMIAAHEACRVAVTQREPGNPATLGQ